MIKTVRLVTILALLSFLAVTAFASVPATKIDVSVSTNPGLHTITWHVKNLTDDSSGFKLVRLDWLYPSYDVSNINPTSWSFDKYQIAANVFTNTDAENAVSWYTTVANGLSYNQSMDFTILSGPEVSTQAVYPLHMLWQRSSAPNGEVLDIGTGVVPEPGSVLTLATGLAGLCGLLTRKKR